MNQSKVNLRVAAKAVIVNQDGEVLILREASSYEEGTNHGRFHVPGGRVNPGEPFVEALKREVLEETGLTIRIGTPIYQGEWWPVIKNVQNQIIAIFMICYSDNKTVRLSEEHDEFVWIKPSDHVKYDLMSPEHEVIEEYIKTI